VPPLPDLRFGHGAGGLRAAATTAASAARRRGLGRRAARLIALAIALTAGLAAAQTLPTEVSGPARVDDEGRLVVEGRRIRLHGIDIPLFERTCRRSVRPVRCAPRAVLALDGFVEGFVHCQPRAPAADADFAGRCTIRADRLFDDRIDLAELMLREGWAFARPGAPPRYHALERLARARERGLWRDDFEVFR